MARPYLPVYLSFILLSFSWPTQGRQPDPSCGRPIKASDTDRSQFAMNFEFVGAEFFLNGALGKGLDSIAPYLAKGGPPPIVSDKKANLDPFTRCVIKEFGYQKVGRLRAIDTMMGGIKRPLMDLSPQNFANIMDRVVGRKLDPPFNPYANSINYLLASYLIPNSGLGNYVGTIPYLSSFKSKTLVASLLGVESGQDAVVRTLLSQRAKEAVAPYKMTVADFTIKITKLRNKRGMCGIKEEGIIVPRNLGAENRTTSNILSADWYSVSYSRTPEETLRIVYGSGDEAKPGGFYPRGANGLIARRYLTHT